MAKGETVIRLIQTLSKKSASTSVRLSKAMVIAQELVETLEATPGAQGLAAPQIGCQGRIIAVRAYRPLRAKAYIRPNIIEMGSRVIWADERCLNHPSARCRIDRPTFVLFSHISRVTRKRVEGVVTGIEARAFLHQMEHLDGLCQVLQNQQRIAKAVKAVVRFYVPYGTPPQTARRLAAKAGHLLYAHLPE